MAEVSTFFWSRVNKTSSCWLWQDRTNADGYGYIKHSGTRTLAHRFAWSDTVGVIPEHAMLDHLCHVRSCVNPAHLRLATSTINNQNRKGPSAHSKSGVRGVYWERSRRLWVGEVRANKTRHRKRFASMEEAEQWTIATRKSLHE